MNGGWVYILNTNKHIVKNYISLNHTSKYPTSFEMLIFLINTITFARLQAAQESGSICPTIFGTSHSYDRLFVIVFQQPGLTLPL